MAPFFSKPLFKRKKKQPTGVAGDTILEEEHHYGGTDSHVYSLSGGDPYGQHVAMASHGPAKPPSRWKSVLRRKPLPNTQEVIVPHDHHFIDSEYQPLTVSGPHTTGGPTVLPGESAIGHHYEPTIHPVHPHVISEGSDGSDEHHNVLHRNHSHGHSQHGSVRRHQTGVSQVQTILPHDSASNIHVEYVPQHTGVRPLQGIVEEQSDVEYKSVRSHPNSAHGQQQQFVSTHPIGHGLHLHQVAPRENGGRLPPLEVTDGHGRRQKVQEVILDGSGIQEIPMPADGNVIFIVEEGVTLDVKDPETGEYIPLEEWYRRLAERTPPKPQDRYIVVNGDASNIIVEDADGQIIHRGERVKSEYIHRHEMERTHSHSSGSHSRAGSPHSGHHSHQQHIIDRKGRQISIKNTHPDPQLRLYTADPKSPGGKRALTDHLVITTPPKQQFQHPAVVSVRPPGRTHHRADSVGSSRSSSASSSSRSKRSSGSSQHAGQFTRGPNGLMTASEMETTPEPSVLGVTSKPVDYFSIKPHGHQDPNGPVENFEATPTGVYLASIPEGSREFLPPKHHHSQTSLATRSIGRSASHRSKASTGGGFMAMPEPVHFGPDGQPLPPGTPASEFGHASAQNSPISYKSHKSHRSKARTGSLSGASVHPSLAPPRSSNAVSFADNALVINAYPDPESSVMVDETGHVLEPIAAGTPRSMRPSISQTPAVAAIHLPEGSPAHSAHVISPAPSVRAMSPAQSARVVSPVPSNRAMTPSRGMSPVVSLRNVAPGGSPVVQEIVMPTPHVSGPPSVMSSVSRKSSKKKTRRDILAGAEPSPPPVPPISMPEPEPYIAAEQHVEEPAFVVEPPQVVELHEEYPAPDGAVDLSSPPHTPSPFQPLTRTVSAKSKASKASKASKSSGWGLWGWGGKKEEEEEAQEEEHEGGFPGGFTNPLTAHPTGASQASRHTNAPLAAQPTGGSTFSRHTANPLTVQPTGGSTFSRHTTTPLTAHPTGGSAMSRHTSNPLTAQQTGASSLSRHGSSRSINAPAVERIASPGNSPQNARGSPQRGLPAIPGSPLYDPYSLPEESAPPPPPLSIHTDVSRRPSLASRLHSTTGPGSKAPSIISNHIAMPEPQVDMIDPYPSPGGLPSVHDSYGSNRHTKHSGNMSFVQEPLDGEFPEPVVHVSPLEVDKDPATGSRRVSAVVSVTGSPAVIEMPAPMEMPAPIEMPTPTETPKEEDADWAMPKKKAPAKKGGAGGKKGGKKK